MTVISYQYPKERWYYEINYVKALVKRMNNCDVMWKYDKKRSNEFFFEDAQIISVIFILGHIECTESMPSSHPVTKQPF